MLNGLAVYNMLAGKYEDAEQLLNEALGKNNNDADTLANLVACLPHTGKSADLVKRYERCDHASRFFPLPPSFQRQRCVLEGSDPLQVNCLAVELMPNASVPSQLLSTAPHHGWVKNHTAVSASFDRGNSCFPFDFCTRCADRILLCPL